MATRSVSPNQQPLPFSDPAWAGQGADAQPLASTEPPAPVWLAEFSGVEVMHRTRMFASPSILARVMRTIEASALPHDQVVELWRWVMTMQIAAGLQPNTTVARYAEILARFLRWCLDQPMDWRSLNAQAFDSWAKALDMQHRNGASWRRTQLQAVRNYYSWRHRMGLGADCAAHVKAPRVTKRTPRRYTMANMRAMLGAVTDRAHSPLLAQRDYCLILFLYATGARRDEAAQLRLDQLEIGEKVGRVRFFGKGAKERTVGIEGPVVRALRNWIFERDHHSGISDCVFWSTDKAHGNFGQPMCGKSLELLVRRYAQAGGLGSHGVHRFRVTYATELYDHSGGDLERLRIALGHESIETTRRYLAVSDKQTSTRMPAHRQFSAMGEKPDGLPLWAKNKEGAL